MANGPRGGRAPGQVVRRGQRRDDGVGPAIEEATITLGRAAARRAQFGRVQPKRQARFGKKTVSPFKRFRTRSQITSKLQQVARSRRKKKKKGLE